MPSSRSLRVGLPLALLAVVVAALAIAAAVRGADSAEVLAAVAFVPIVAGIYLWDWRGGLGAAFAATIVYGVVRSRDAGLLGQGETTRLILTRALAFAAFGGLGGWCHRQLRRRLHDAAQVDTRDPDTGLVKGSVIGEVLDLELARAARYGNAVSLVSVVIPVEVFAGVRGARRRSLLRELGDLTTSCVRAIDRVGVVRRKDAVELAAVLPQTDETGAAHVAARVRQRAEDVLEAHGITGAVCRSAVRHFPAAPPAGVLAARVGDAVAEPGDGPGEASATREPLAADAGDASPQRRAGDGLAEWRATLPPG